MKCDMARDLLPSYIEKLTSSHSNEEIEKHLQTCEECLQYYKEMTKPTDLSVPVMDKEEVENINFLKKVKQKNRKTLLLSILAVLILMAAIIKLFAIGFTVSSQDVDIVHQKVNGRLEVHLSLKKNGQDLVFSGNSKFIYDENDNVIGYETRYTPKGVLHNPFDDVGDEIMLGTEMNNDTDYSNTFILVFKDKTMTFIDGVLVE